MSWDTDSKIVYLMIGLAMLYLAGVVIYTFGRKYYWKYRFRKAREQRSKYQLTMKKEKEKENQ